MFKFIKKIYYKLFPKTEYVSCYHCKHSIYGAGPEYCEDAYEQGFGYIDLRSQTFCTNYQPYEEKDQKEI